MFDNLDKEIAEKSIKGKEVIGTYLDVSLYKKVEGEAPISIKETENFPFFFDEHSTKESLKVSSDNVALTPP